MQTIHGRVMAIACVWATGAALAHCGGLDGSTVDPNDCHVVNTCGSAVESGIPGADAPGADNAVPGDAPEGGGPEQEAGSETSPCSAPTSLDCNGTCVDPTLPANCGSCGHACAGADGGQATCMAGGVCGVACDPNSATPVNCNGACVNVQNDPLHCGSCTVACPPAASGHGTAMCSASADGGGTCGLVCTAGTPGSAANPGYHVCMGDCLPNTDAPSVAGDPCVISEGFGVFVQPPGPGGNGGNDKTGNGSQTMPYATLGNAIDKAVAQGAARRVYACASAGSFVENLVVNAARDAVSVFGGFDCTTSPGTWTYNATLKTTVAPPSQYALKVTGLTQGVTFEDFVFRAADATSPGGSSIAVFVTGAQNLVFHRVAMVAGAGVTGAPGASGGTTGNPSNWYSGSLNGNAATAGVAGGASNTCKCGAGPSSTGGQGGGPPTQMPGSGMPGPPLYSGGMPGMNNQDFGLGGPGADGPAGVPDPPSMSRGTLAATGWTPAAGVQGSHGRVGQGGGGGGDGFGEFGFGGGGACGGCGGSGGKPGGAGGSSIALLSYQSGVTLVACTLTAASGGAGGAGGDGQAGQTWGFGGVESQGAPGGRGGAGAGGNGGQGGAGGLSLGIGYSGTAPIVDASTATTVGSLGVGGAGGAGGGAALMRKPNPGADGAKGPDGVMQTTPLAL